ncbi:MULTISPECIES: mannose-1-phosphate guanylyltransferase/mannose-6-phosphate isomerase [unclassified Ensifer]|uniref:mannose-1-phosphate guanylyltransferase/mannose-6-phosphate isomerase n=1 Tax=unclassified Ensifer TaxID=2633371 RepID=UPI000812F0E5|nr:MULTISPECIES: mannose-1-phosphate guanylyltransferase/mannose-6-phosphate isomerase [unclassified Ensifer]OCP11098.1 mannose-1-phosphate guanylyltransferase/mannose-6-phosphate isomerase [Ensifer sp. LC14]OCP12730.1 mannose-1-phosphate guanylyltransferase/mannose-6-phosphate isomerase [Ensifer sp. LC13]OCP13422.1 mannose-1-phosphate guanylyltransferase/mannose-6-phosphate isomerase [Ensifer sp. LC11]OCP34173.1 mannose-1-phosphate guanylyltransferase/mannose-6-phosphate isomerase [Ensifer sp.
MTSKIVPVIMAGGKGTRLWPLSRSAAPKQFLQILSDRSLFQQTLERVSDPARYEPAIVVTNSDFRFIVAEQARAIDVDLGDILLEPVARNTAPALAAAAFSVLGRFGQDAIMQVLASDHEIDAGAVYMDCIRRAQKAALNGELVTFGITPTEPATGYGYIEAGDELTEGTNRVARFVEKPDRAKAEAMLATGRYLWNSGMFMLPVKLFLDEVRRFAPKVEEAARGAVEGAHKDLDFTRLHAESFAAAPDISIDYAVFEKTEHAAVVPSAFPWSDLGSWDAVWKTGRKDGDGNVVTERATVSNTRNSLVLSRDIHLAVQGLEDVAVIAGEDAVYVGRLDDSQSVGNIVKALARSPRTAALTEVHPTSYRPWGAVAALSEGERFAVKRLHVTPGRKISLQKHHHRAEHWIVVRGTAEITMAGETRLLHENESIYIPPGTVHRLYNPGKIPLELIEVQTGSYLGEDDIIRIEDEFGRH